MAQILKGKVVADALTEQMKQDVEQLRIRMEAFGEMLTQKIIVKRKVKRSA